MIFKRLPLDGAYLIELEKNEDERGFFARMFCADEFNNLGLNSKWTQINDSFSKKAGTLRGLHFQKAPFAEVKAVRCVRGAIWDVMVDLRLNSKTFGMWCGVELSDENRNMAYIPQGFAHGYITLTDNSEIIYLVSNCYSKDHEVGLLWSDKKLGINWPMLPSCISLKDENNLTLDNLLSLKFL